MKSEFPKALHPICARPMLGYVLDLTRDLKIKNIVAVLGHKYQEVRKILEPGVRVAIQKKLAGTADAVKVALRALRSFKGTVLVLYADNPLLEKSTIEKLIKHHRENNLAATLLTAKLEKPFGYGRVIRDQYSSISGIVEEKDADDFQKEIKEINTGIVCFDKEKLARALKKVRPNNRKKEYYLTDCIGILHAQGELIDNIKLEDVRQALGINSRADLAAANKVMQKRINEGFMKEGVSIVSPETTFIGFGTKIGKDSSIFPFTVIEKNVKIGKHCSIGPFVHLREGTILEDEVIVANFLEISRSTLSYKTIAKHFGYIGDCRIGKMVNIGAGAVTANFDGSKKNDTVIKDSAFIGCDTVLVAPVNIGRGARTGAGSVVTKNTRVSDGETVVGIPAKRLIKRTR
jgi:bifunctional UDP-N-acetylglucosamine pyrophosphorylase/glucosamine-1-phosphate N-acetyltransferase